MKKRVLYLHGLESSNVGNKVDFLKQVSYCYAPEINYEDDDIEKQLIKMVDAFKPDVIIGSSMGGYVGYMLANRFGIKNLLFNPALHDRSIEPELYSLPYDFHNYNMEFNVVFGKNDDVIDPEVSKKILIKSKVHFNFDEVEMGHRVEFDVFVNMYNKYIDNE